MVTRDFFSSFVLIRVPWFLRAAVLNLNCLKVYTISIDTKIIFKILELLLFPIFDNFARCNQLKIELVSQQNFYPDLTFIHEPTGAKLAVDIDYY
ncbi:MAG: type II restriction endonuclease [Microcystis panniformis]